MIAGLRVTRVVAASRGEVRQQRLGQRGPLPVVLVLEVDEHVTPGLRADWWKNFNARIESPTTTTVPRDNAVSVVNPKLSSAYQLSETLRTGASVYQAFRAPTLNELYRGFGFGGFSFLPNDRLRPERLTGADVKVEGELLADRTLHWRLSAHRDEVKDQILFVSQNQFAAQRQNVGRTLSTGGVADLSYQISPLLTVN